MQVHSDPIEVRISIRITTTNSTIDEDHLLRALRTEVLMLLGERSLSGVGMITMTESRNYQKEQMNSYVDLLFYPDFGKIQAASSVAGRKPTISGEKK